MKKFMESLLKNSIDDESTFYIEITSILTYVVAQLITSVITVLYFKASGSFHIGFIWQFINIFILSICGYCILKNGTSCTAMWVFVIYNFSVFSIMWYFFSFSHQLVIVFYSYYTILNIIILSERMTLAKFLIISNVGSVLLIFDLIFRPEMKIQSDLWVTLIVFVLYQSIYVITYIQIRGYRKLVRSTYLRTLIDPLTKVGNSCAFYKDIDFILSLSSRTGEEFSIIFIDLNDFKLINDKFGHKTGDIVLERFALFMKDSIRKSDSIYRIGGDEFIVLLPNTKISKSSFLEMLNRVDESTLQDEGFSISFSFGIAIYENEGLSIDEFIHQADKKMYQAKKLYKTTENPNVYSGSYEIKNFMSDLIFF